MNRKKQSTGKMTSGIPDEKQRSGYSSEVSSENNVQPKEKAFEEEQDKCLERKSTNIEVVIIQPKVYCGCECKFQAPTSRRTRLRNKDKKFQQQNGEFWRSRGSTQRQCSENYGPTREEEGRPTRVPRNWTQFSTTSCREEEDRYRRNLAENYRRLEPCEDVGAWSSNPRTSAFRTNWYMPKTKQTEVYIRDMDEVREKNCIWRKQQER